MPIRFRPSLVLTVYPGTNYIITQDGIPSTVRELKITVNNNIIVPGFSKFIATSYPALLLCSALSAGGRS